LAEDSVKWQASALSVSSLQILQLDSVIWKKYTEMTTEISLNSQWYLIIF
jgi:hypothetical protein